MNSRRSIAMILLLFITTPLFAQKEIGKIFTPEEALKLYGSVTIEKEVPVAVIKKALAQSSHHVSFNIQNDQLIISSDSKNFTYPATKYFEAPNVEYIFTVNKISEFLNTNLEASNIKVQMRGNILCLDNDKTVLEMSIQCPPYCWDR